MAAVPPRLSGIEGISIHILERTAIPRVARVRPFVEVVSSTGRFPQASVFFDKVPRVIRGPLPVRIQKQVFAWIEMNRHVLMQLWNNEIDQPIALLAIRSVKDPETSAFFFASLTDRQHCLCNRVLTTRALAKRGGEEPAIASGGKTSYVHKVLASVGTQVLRTGSRDRWVLDTCLDVASTTAHRVPAGKLARARKPGAPSSR